MLLEAAELAKRRKALEAKGGFGFPEHQTPWQEIQRGMGDQFDKGMVLKPGYGAPPVQKFLDPTAGAGI